MIGNGEGRLLANRERRWRAELDRTGVVVLVRRREDHVIVGLLVLKHRSVHGKEIKRSCRESKQTGARFRIRSSVTDTHLLGVAGEPCVSG